MKLLQIGKMHQARQGLYVPSEGTAKARAPIFGASTGAFPKQKGGRKQSLGLHSGSKDLLRLAKDPRDSKLTYNLLGAPKRLLWQEVRTSLVPENRALCVA